MGRGSGAGSFLLQLGTVCQVLMAHKELPLKVTAGISDSDSYKQGMLFERFDFLPCCGCFSVADTQPSLLEWKKGYHDHFGHPSPALSCSSAGVNVGFDTFTVWAFGFLTFSPASEPIHLCSLFGSTLPISCSPTCERTWACQAMAERSLVLLRFLIWDNPN